MKNRSSKAFLPMYTALMYKAIAVCLLLIPTIGVSAAQTSRQPKLYRVEVKRPNLVIHGANLSKVELWAMPTGTENTPDMAFMFGSAKRSSKAGAKEVRLFSLEPCPLDAKAISSTEVFVKAYDLHGTVVTTKSLPYYGTSDVYRTFRPAMPPPSAKPSVVSTDLASGTGHPVNDLFHPGLISSTDLRHIPACRIAQSNFAQLRGIAFPLLLCRYTRQSA
jgi:hypothetical protein